MEVMGVGPLELLVILVLILIVVGPQRLPQMAAELARAIRLLRKYSSQITDEFNTTMSELEKEYDDMKGEWTDVGQGLDESVQSVRGELAAAEGDARVSLEEAKPSEPASPTS